jgi:hypothetical protein
MRGKGGWDSGEEKRREIADGHHDMETLGKSRTIVLEDVPSCTHNKQCGDLSVRIVFLGFVDVRQLLISGGGPG